MRSTYVCRPGHPCANERGMVDVRDLGDEPQALAVNAPILSGRFYENTRATDGTDIGSRKRHREYQKQHGLTMASDYTKTWEKQNEQRAALRRGERGALPSKTRREAIARKLYQIDKP